VLMALGGMGIGFLTVAAVQRWSIPDSMAGIYTFVYLAGQTAGNLSFGLLADRKGHKLALEIGATAGALAFLLAWLAMEAAWFYAVFALAGIAAAIPLCLTADLPSGVVIVGGLAMFGAIFAINSAVHSYLILDYTDGDKVALNVGFYYMANAGGRLVGCLLSGVLYQAFGLAGCLWGAFAFALAAAVIALKLPRAARHAEKLAQATVMAEGE